MRWRWSAPSASAPSTNDVSDRRVSRATRCIVASGTPSASWTTASPLPWKRSALKTSSQVKRCPAIHRSAYGRRLLIEVEVARRLLLEPEAVVLGRLLEELRRLLEHVLATRLGIGLDHVGIGRPRRGLVLERVVDRDLVGLVEPRLGLRRLLHGGHLRQGLRGRRGRGSRLGGKRDLGRSLLGRRLLRGLRRRLRRRLLALGPRELAAAAGARRPLRP